MTDERLSRRDLLRGQFSGQPEPRARPEEAKSPAAQPAAAKSQAVPASRFPKSFPVLRPPGAVEEEAFLTGCTQCNACIEACPHEAIVHAPPRYRRAAGTPTIDPILQPCWMCEGFPCIPVCEPRVLRLDLPKSIGIARIDTLNCLPYQGQSCSQCVEECPVPGALQIMDGKPKIVEDICTGCGVCQFVCPAPDNAILLMPLAERPLPPGKMSHVESK